MKRATKHRILQQVFWSRGGLPLVRAYTAFARRWDYVVMNRSLLPETNGEYWLLSLLPPAPLIVDVGFNEGRFTREALRQRPNARIIGFEPAESMQRKFALNFPEESRVELLPFAVSNRPGTLVFCDSSDGSNAVVGEGRVHSETHRMETIHESDVELPSFAVSPTRGAVGECDASRGSTALVGEARVSSESYQVESIRLDEFTEGRGDFLNIAMLKIDAEGYDLHALEGADRLLDRQAIDIFSFEYNLTWIESRRFLREAWTFLARKPYGLFRLFNGFLASFTYSQRAERHDLGCVYVGVSRSRLKQGGIPMREFPQ
jgi:FkbM family methyltransferase